MSEQRMLSPDTLGRDLRSGLVVFLVALPLCLGIALASGTEEIPVPLFAGVISGIVGGLIIGPISRSPTSVSGPAAGLTAVVAAQLTALGSFQAFLLAVMLAGVIQIGLGIARAGFLAGFFPTSVIKGLLAAIGVILILKQIPHLFGHDADPEGEMSFQQPDEQNTFSELIETLSDIHVGATAIGLFSIALLLAWDRIKFLKKTGIPAPVVVVVLGVMLAEAIGRLGDRWIISGDHLVKMPQAESLREFATFLQMPDFNALSNPQLYVAAVTIAIVASLETLLNLEAVDRLDPQQRVSPPSRELFAQGVGNVVSGLIGGLPVTSVIVRSSVNINSGCQTKLSTIFHGALLLTFAALFPHWLNRIPLSCLAAILLVTGFKLASPQLARQMWRDGRYQFIPFVITVVAIVFTDLLIGILIGLVVSISFILNSNLRRPIRRVMEKHLGGDVLRIELAEQVSFLKRGSLTQVLDSVEQGGHLLLDARGTDYIDPDVLNYIREFKEITAPARDVQVSLLGFRTKYALDDHIQYVDYATRELQSAITPRQALEILREGHRRFLSGERLNRDLSRQVSATAEAQHPFAVVLSCIDSRAPAELIFDAGVGDIFSARIAGNCISPKVLGSIEYACEIAGAKLVVVMGHTRCGAVTAAVSEALIHNTDDPESCGHLETILREIQESLDGETRQRLQDVSESEREALVNEVARRNVRRVREQLVEQSGAIAQLVEDGQIMIVGAMYDVVSGDLEFIDDGKLVEKNLADRSELGA